jgi:hypothetical protein
MRLVPHISLIKFHFVFLQERAIFVLKTTAAMMFFLVGDISLQIDHTGLSD